MQLVGIDPMKYMNQYKKGECDSCHKETMVKGKDVWYESLGFEIIRLYCRKCYKKSKKDKSVFFVGRGKKGGV